MFVSFAALLFLKHRHWNRRTCKVAVVETKQGNLTNHKRGALLTHLRQLRTHVQLSVHLMRSHVSEILLDSEKNPTLLPHAA
jgi:hypothetical protein